MIEDHSVIMKRGRVTGRIAPGYIGEVMLSIRGGTEAFYAYAKDPSMVIEPGQIVVVVAHDSARTITVEPESNF